MADRDPSPHVQIRVLGHLEASVGDRPVVLGGAKQRAVLAMLGLEAGRPVSADRLIEGLWGETPPPSAGKMVQNYVWRLRRGGADILTRGRAYELHADVDACRLERLVAEAVRATEAGRPGGAAREALALFHGEPLADVAGEPFAAAEIRRLEELRLTAAELAIEADLASGHNRLSEIDALLADHPLRERLHAQRMLALYRGGRQAEALEAFREARRRLVEEIGVEPTPELRRLHDAILRQDPALDAPAQPALPAALDATGAPPLVGREAELRELRALWRRGGVLVTLAGAAGMGKTRLAAELAGEAHREGATVGYVSGAETPAGPPPDLLVVDDGDRGAAPGRPERGLVLVTGRDAAALAALEPDAAVVLAPLGARDIAAVAGFYTPAGGGTPPVAELARGSGGVPRRVHELAGAWARGEALRRVDEAAGRAAAGRSEARALQDELAGSVAELRATRERTGAHRAGARHVCPYKGLATFDREDAAYFFGRERLVAELVARLVGAPLLAVVGPSGSGKSSVVRAGLLPALADGMLPGSEGWAQQVIRPGAQPVRELRRARRRLEREWRGVLVVDQFEELFTACRDEDERRAFAAGVVSAGRDRGVAVVLVVRADFYGRCAGYPELAELMGANHVLVGPMGRDELARAIERPAIRTGLSVDPDLVSALLADVEGRPGALPLLSTALLELWRDRDGSALRLAAYLRGGGVHSAVARLAEDAYLQLDAAGRAGARRLLLRLTDEDAGGAPVRRRLALAEADPELVAHLADRRLLTVDDETVEVAHEALLREWPRLRSWLDEDAQGRRLQRGLATAARAWQAGEGELYRGARLAAALEWAAGHPAELGPGERAFLEASRRAATRAQRRLRAGLAGAIALAAIAVAAGVLALHQRAVARGQATAAAAQSLGSQALAQGDLSTALLLARQGLALHDSPQTRGNLLTTLLKSPEAVGVLSTAGVTAGPALSPDGRTLALIDDGGKLRFFAARTRRPIGPALGLAGVWEIADGMLRFSPDGEELAVGGGDPAIVDVRTHRVRARMLILNGVTADRLAFSPDGRVLAALLENEPSGRASLVRFDARTGAQLDTPKPLAPLEQAALMVAPDGRVVTSRAGGPTVVRAGRTLRPLRRLAPGAAAAALAPDGQTMVLGDGAGTVRFLDLRSGRARTGSGRHAGAVEHVAFSADGRTAASAGDDDRVIAWDPARAAPRATLSGHAAAITGLAVAPRGGVVYSADVDGETIVSDLAGPGRFGRPFGIGATGRTAFALGGRLLAIGHADGRADVIDARTLRTLRTFRAVPGGPVGALAFVPRGGPLVVGGDDGFLALYDARSGRRLQRLRGQFGSEVRISLSADGSRMATLSAQDSIALWTLRHSRVAGPPRRRTPSYVPSDLSLSPDGRTLAIRSPGSVELVDAGTFARRALRPTGLDVIVLGPFTPDGRALLVMGDGGWTQLWSARTLRSQTREFGGPSPGVPTAAVSPDGRVLAIGDGDGTVQLYDLPSQQPLGAPLPTPATRGAIPASAFSADGAHLFAITGAGAGYRWDVRPASWAARACAVAGRALSRAEWSGLLPGRPYAPACAG